MAIKHKLAGTQIGTISPKNIEAELTQLKIKGRSSGVSVLNSAIGLFEGYNGKIRLFNLGTSSTGRSPIPASMPFTVSKVRARAEEGVNSLPVDTAVLMNMYRIGNWSANEDQYIGLSALTDLFTVLESGFVMYKFVAESQYNKVLNNKNLLQALTKIYTWMFNKAMIKAGTVYSNDFNTSAASFLIAKFFLRYVLKKQETDSLADYAYEATDMRASIRALRDFEENSEISYDSLSGFLKTFSRAIYGSEIVTLAGFQSAWISLYGEGLLFAVEYIPYLIHFLLGVVHGASLGNSSRLMMYKPDLTKRGLDLFYRQLISEMM